MSYDILSVGDQPNNNGTNSNLSTEPEKVDEPAPAPAGTETTQPAGDAPADTTEKPAEEPPKEEEKPEEVEDKFFFDGVEVEVDVPEDISAAFAEKGIDSKAVLKELFADGGKFELTPETKAKLDEAFGKSMVDGYLNLYRQQNSLALKQNQAEAEAATKLQAEITESFNTLVGGDDGWDKLSQWAEENMDEKSLASFNAVMSLPSEHWSAQHAVIEALKIKQQAADTEANGTGMGKLIGDDGSPSPSAPEGVPAVLTRSQFQELMFSEKYKTDPAYAARVDAIRRASADKGIV